MTRAAVRPTVTEFTVDGNPLPSHLQLPDVFKSPIRPDVVNFYFRLNHRNTLQPHAQTDKAGYDCSAESWGTGRAVARIPRVRGGGTHRSGQGAFGNMCRGGRMFSPIKIWRRWHRLINPKKQHLAMCSAIAATGVTSLVFARGHRIGNVPEIPLVVSDEIEGFQKTKQAIALLKKLGCMADVERVMKSIHKRSTMGKHRNRKWINRRGPLLVYKNDNGCTHAFRNLKGFDIIDVNKLALLKVCPGGHLGRLIIWSKSAFEHLHKLYGSYAKKTTKYPLPLAKMTYTDMTKLFESQEIKAVMKRPNRSYITRSDVPKGKLDPFSDITTMLKLNPYHLVMKKENLLSKVTRDTLRESGVIAKEQAGRQGGE